MIYGNLQSDINDIDVYSIFADFFFYFSVNFKISWAISKCTDFSLTF